MLRMRELAFVTVIAMTAMAGASAWQSFQLSVRSPVAAKAQTGQHLAQASHAAPVASQPHRVAQSGHAVVVWHGITAQTVPPPDGDEPGDARVTRVAQIVVPDVALDAQADDVAARLRERVPADLIPYFDVFLYVSKSAEGPWAQHMFVFHRADNGGLVYEQNFPVSTGRELHEKYFTSTPVGIFELDPNRFETMHYSHTWHGAPMAWAMFLNYTHNWRQVGIALHSAGEHVPDLGHRASGGCVRLPPDMADALFHRFQAQEFGRVPVLAFDEARGTTSVTGDVIRDITGKPLMTPGYKVLLFIEDYPGGPALVAVLS